MTKLEKIQQRLAQPDLAKFKRHHYNFYNLTEDERKRVLKKHRNFRRYYLLVSAKMRIVTRQLSDALQAGGLYGPTPDSLTQDSALQVESLDDVLKTVTYDEKHLKLYSVKDSK